MPIHIPYTILSQDQSEILTPSGTFADVWRVVFQGPSGTTANVQILASNYSPATVDAAIQAALQKIEGVMALGTAPASDLGLA